MLIVTTNDLPGWEIRRVCGEVFGLTVRSRNAFAQMGAGFKAMFGGELQGMTKNLADSRNEAMGRLIAEARSRGGNAIVAMRFDTTEIGDVWTEICAYGTAVEAVPGDGRREIHGKPARVRRVAPTAVIVCSPVRSV
nr:YbjQ family protein [Mycobacterium sherrisii]